MTRNKIQLPPFLIKFGREEYISQLRNDGIIYFNSLNYFRKIENDEVRRDALEGVVRIEQLRDVQLYLEGKLIARTLPSSNSHLCFHDNENIGNVFSMYAITENEHTDPEFKFDRRLLQFGDKLLLITDTKAFIKKIISQIESRNLHFNLGYVKYYNKNLYSGILDPFHKPDNFNYQNEFRIYIQSKYDMSIQLEIGSIKNITQVFDISMIENFKIVSARTISKDQLKKAKEELRNRKELTP